MRLRTLRIHAIGIASMLTMIASVGQAGMASADPTPAATTAAPIPADPTPTAPADRPIVHQVPRVPLTIDGKPVDPATITKYNGQPLYMAVLRGDGPHGRLATFTNSADFERFVSEQGGPAHTLAQPREFTQAQAAKAQSSAERWGTGVIYEHPGSAGSRLSVPAGYGWPDLTQKRMQCGAPIDIFCSDWNDKASTAAALSGEGVMLWEHIRWGGSSLWLQSGMWLDNLGYYGWNDRTSSFAAY
ncbi:hypothetical protein [Sphaerisporangium sp. NPDC051011]|uniref:hypothetical protein n=1 Tax=Sphaerisporangium sp. NPDC051011 TaxID=3155792 RepID=UPI0033F69660